jgi:hypothetical protein
LHGMVRGVRVAVLVGPIVGVIHNGAWAPFPLRNDAGRSEP